MFSTVGRHGDAQVLTRAVLAVVLMSTVVWAAAWAWIVARVATWAFWMLVWLASLLWSLLSPTYQPLALPQFFAALEEPEEIEVVEVEVDAGPEPIRDLSEEWETPGDAETLDEGDLAEAEEMYATLQEAERSADRMALDSAIAESVGMLAVLSAESLDDAEVSGFMDLSAEGDGEAFVVGAVAEGTVGRGGGGEGGEGFGRMGGLGMRGAGAGGGGKGYGLIGGQIGDVDGASRARRSTPRLEVRFPEIVAGALDGDEVQAAARQRRGALQYCYERAVHGGFEGEGTVTIAVEIDESGRVADARVVSSGLTDDTVEGCAARVLRRVRFPVPPGGPATVHQPLAFTIE